MSEYTFKNLSDVTKVEEPADGTTVMGFENGTPIQMPMSAIKGNGGVFLINPEDPDFSTSDAVYGNKVKDALLSGKIVWVYEVTPASTTITPSYEESEYSLVMDFTITENTKGEHILTFSTKNLGVLTFIITV